MTEGSTKDRGRFLSVGPTLLVAGTLLAGASIFSAMACETIARIPFSDRTFRDIQPVSVTPAGGQCDDVAGIASDGDATMRMVFLDNSNEPIKPGEEVDRAFVEPQQSDLGFSGGRLYSLPDLACADDASCGNLNCMDIDPDDDDLGDRCQRDTGVSVGSQPVFVGEDHASQAIAVGISEVGRWRGWYSGDFSGYHVFDEEGTNELLRNDPIREIAVDHDGNRETALRDMDDDFETLTEYVDSDDREAHFGLWTFGESSSEVRSRVEDPNPSGSMWTTEPVVATSAVGSLPSVRQGRSDVYNSIMEVLDQGFQNNPDLGNPDDIDHKALVFIVSGYDERKRQSVDDVINLANQLDVEISIVQVDEPRDMEYLRDDWVYYEDDDPCTDDSECANFESCRPPIRYTTSSSTNDVGDVDFPRQDDIDSSFCLPNYEADEEGMARIGPIGDYNRLACETGGSYTYVPASDRALIHNPLQGLIWSGEAAWEIDFSIDDYGRIEPNGEGAGRAHLLETTLDVTIGRLNTFSFENDGNRDTRRAFFAPAN